MVVHGIPDDRPLVEGELLSIDCGAILAGWHGDAAVTVPVGECGDELLALCRVTEQALWAGVAACRPGGRLSDIGHAVESLVRPHGYGLLEDYTGHGIGTSMHEPPNVPNLAPKGPGKGMELEVGHVLAVEPMAVLGSAAGRRARRRLDRRDRRRPAGRALGAHRGDHRGRPLGAHGARRRRRRSHRP